MAHSEENERVSVAHAGVRELWEVDTVSVRVPLDVLQLQVFFQNFVDDRWARSVKR